MLLVNGCSSLRTVMFSVFVFHVLYTTTYPVCNRNMLGLLVIINTMGVYRHLPVENHQRFDLYRIPCGHAPSGRPGCVWWYVFLFMQYCHYKLIFIPMKQGAGNSPALPLGLGMRTPSPTCAFIKTPKCYVRVSLGRP